MLTNVFSSESFNSQRITHKAKALAEILGCSNNSEKYYFEISSVIFFENLFFRKRSKKLINIGPKLAQTVPGSAQRGDPCYDMFFHRNLKTRQKELRFYTDHREIN